MPTIGRRFHFNYRFLLSAALFLVVTVPAFGKSDGLAPAEVASFVENVDGDTLRLKAREYVLLVSLQAPKLPLGRPNYKTWLLRNETKDALAHLALGKWLHPGLGGRKWDRHCWVLANLHAQDVTCI